MDKTTAILDALDTMRRADLAKGDKFPAIAYAKAIKGLRALGKPIVVLADVEGVPGIGAKIKLKIQEIIETGSLAAAEEVKRDTTISIYDALLKIHGVGPVAAKKLVAEGITSIDGLRAHPELLNEVQLMGLKYYEDILLRIPRDEMREHETLLRSSLPRACAGVIVGSYRRKAESSGDIDMLVSFQDREMCAADQRKAFHEFVARLSSSGYIRDILALGDKKCMAVVCLGADRKARRLDLLLTPHDEFAYSILYFTGSDTFNVAFRKHAQTRGYTLNEHILKPVAPGVSPVPAMSTEEDIFQFLGIQYISPEERKGPESLRTTAGTPA